MRAPLDPTVRIQRQVLDQPIRVPGTSYALHYGSDRAPGRAAANRVSIPLTGSTVRSGATEVVVEIHVAGQIIRKVFPPRPNLVEDFHWDGLAGNGSAAPARQVALVRIGTTGRGQWPQPRRIAWREYRLPIGSWDAMSQGLGGWTLDVHHALDRAGSTLWMGDGERRTNLDPGAMLALEFGTGVPSTDGTEVFVFDGDDRHTATLDGLTGSMLRRFQYDGGLLVAVTDQGTTRIERDRAGTPIAIAGPYGGRTSLETGPQGELAGMTDPAGGRVQFSYAPGRLLSGFVDQRGGRYAFEYDPDGRLVRWTDPAGAATSLARIVDRARTSVTVTGPSGESTVYEDARLPGGSRRRSSQCGTSAPATETRKPGGKRSLTIADGTTAEALVTVDPAVPGVERIASATRRTPGGRMLRLDVSTLVDGGDTATSRVGLGRREQISTNGAPWLFAWDPKAGTMTYATPEGRQSRLQLNAAGGVVGVEAPGRDAMRLTYERGRLQSAEQGSWRETWAFDDARRVVARTDGNGGRTELEADPAGRPVRMTSPAGHTVRLEYDAAGAPTRITMPGGRVHAYTTGVAGLVERHQSPGGAVTAARYDADRRLVDLQLPSGRRLTSRYGLGGRLEGRAFPEGSVTYAYGIAPNRLARVERVAADGTVQGLALEYDGDFLTGQAFEGPAAGRFAYRLDDQGRVAGVSLDGAAETLIERDRDGQVVAAGPLVFARDGSGVDVTRVTVGATAIHVERDGRGRMTGKTIAASGRELYALAIEYDAADRITVRTERIAGDESREQYTYDPDGRLVRAAGVDHTTTAEYDANGNRSVISVDDRVVRASYDADDRLVEFDGRPVQNDADGFVAAMADGTRLEYSARGELLAATAASGVRVQYGYDGIGRRVSRTAGTGTSAYLYGDPAALSRITAIRSPSGIDRLWYDGDGFLAALDRDGTLFIVATDQVGTPRAVFQADGTLAARPERDAWGVRRQAADALSLDIGFAGGLEDSLTGLVRFGHRDYDPTTGRWTAQDPAAFESGQWNLYAYSGNDPVGGRDPSGLSPQTPEQDEFFGPLPSHPVPDSVFRPRLPPPNPYVQNPWSGRPGSIRDWVNNHHYWQPDGWSSGPGRGFSICPSGGNVSHDPYDQSDVAPGLHRDPTSGHVGPQNSSNDPGMPSGYGPIIKIRF